MQIDGSATTTVEGATILESLIGDLGFEDLVSMDLTEDEQLANQGVEPGDLVSVRLVSFELEALSGDPDLSFLDSMEVSAAAPDVAEVVVARQDEFPAGEAVVAFELTDAELVDHAVSQSMTITTDVSAQRPTRTTEVEARYVVEVQATLKGAAKQR